jgi:hypothetical protein
MKSQTTLELTEEEIKFVLKSAFAAGNKFTPKEIEFMKIDFSMQKGGVINLQPPGSTLHCLIETGSNDPLGE